MTILMRKITVFTEKYKIQNFSLIFNNRTEVKPIFFCCFRDVEILPEVYYIYPQTPSITKSREKTVENTTIIFFFLQYRT